ncbi:MAG TPA: hypothetical protein VFA85_16700 [Terriglobales bacterium]|nr:hypothetical protein [Terriglobales bacterium]
MIGVIAKPADHNVVSEFFELFKTGWELFQRDRHYDVVISDGSVPLAEIDARTVVLYSAQSAPEDKHGKVASKEPGCHKLQYGDLELPIYDGVALFPSREQSFLTDAECGQPASYSEQDDERTLLRVGYDLFSEVRFLLTRGQSVGQASIPALEIHIALLRDLLITHGAPLVEIPPVPKGYKFIACLTHDMDHPSILCHKFDHTTAGFLYRAIFGSLINLATGRGTFRQMMRNWWAAAKLPLVYLGLAKDFWLDFTRYVELDRHPATFYFIPFKGKPGQLGAGSSPGRRAAGYDVGNLRPQLEQLKSAKCEIALHGIDAWHNAARARQESQRIQDVGGRPNGGVRMHWLYFDDQSPVTLESAGLNYDSTVGFNETIGYRAGTTQVYRPLNSSDLLELPLHVMDTALFYPTYLNLRHGEAMERVKAVIENAKRFGGCITINWHDRSIAPERCWDDFYEQLVQELETNGAWFSTAQDVVLWFRKRRAIEFGSGAAAPGIDEVDSQEIESAAPLQWRTYNVANAEYSASLSLENTTAN